MRILCVDVGTGTQDILVFDSRRELENSTKLVMPSPTVAIAERIRAATQRGEALLLSGVTMGGGPSHWAAMDHLRAGYSVYATPAAAQTFDDDLDSVERVGIRVVSEDEAAALANVTRVMMRDFWLEEIASALALFGAQATFDAVAIAVFDHGAAPPGYSDRVFRFEYLAERVRAEGSLAAFAFERHEIPPRLTRLQAVAQTIPADLPALVMDTAPAAVLGALEDPRVAAQERAVVVNVGNFHCLAFRLAGGHIAGLFEHHTGELSPHQLESFVRKLMAGTITNQEVFQSMGHGAVMFDPRDVQPPTFVAVTGPRRELLRRTSLRPYLAVPHGDMMLAGCFGLLRAWAARDEQVAAAVNRVLSAEC
ncbi:MAG: DUF1786 domain-containing protein [Chloroflexi bacterium]|nr:DUF1786 domain-containing protein [Chloroflexota bacterium]